MSFENPYFTPMAHLPTVGLIKPDLLYPHQGGGDNRLLFTAEQKHLIWFWVDENRLLTLKELCQKVLETFGIQCSTITIDRLLKVFHYTLKRAYPIPAHRNYERTIKLRYEYAAKF